jgi:hypothetical protein
MRRRSAPSVKKDHSGGYRGVGIPATTGPAPTCRRPARARSRLTDRERVAEVPLTGLSFGRWLTYHWHRGSSTGSPISCRHRGSTGTATTAYLRRITSTGGPSRRWRSATLASGAMAHAVSLSLRERGQAHHDREAIQATADELPVIDIHSLPKCHWPGYPSRPVADAHDGEITGINWRPFFR